MEDLNAKEWLDNDELAYKIWDKKYRNNGESFNAWLKRISNNDSLLETLIRQKKFIFGGRILDRKSVV